MPYLVRELPNFSANGRQWRAIRESALTVSSNAAHTFCLLLLSRRGFKHAVSSVFRRQRRDSNNRVVLRQQDRAENGRVVKETFFQLCEGHLEECRVEMEGVDTFLKIVLFHGQMSMSLDLLNDLIKPYGPIGREELAEVVVRWDIDGSLDHDHFQPYIKLGKKLSRGKSLLHAVIEDGKVNLTKKLCSVPKDYSDGLGVCMLNEVDAEENNVFHLAARSGKREAIRALVPRSYSLVTTEVTRGGSTSSEHFDSLGEAKLALDGYNQVGDTPLAIAAKEGYFAVVLSLLLVDANPNVVNHTTKSTPLHLAASGGYLDIVKALLAFGANPNLKDRDGKTPIDLAAGHPGILDCFSSLKEAVEAGKLAAENKPTSEQLDSSGPYLLCMDGGGIRGLATCVILRELEDHVKRLDPEYDHLGSYFDYVTGTSIGSYIACFMAYRKENVREIIKLFFHLKESIFVHHRPFPEESVNGILKELFTEDAVMSSVTEPKVIALTTKADVSPPILHCMRNTGPARNGEKGPDELKIWEATRASSAAPTYFPPFGYFIDGGLMANNPTVDCIGEVVDDLLAEGKPPRLGLVLSVSTCSNPRSKLGDINIHSISKLSDVVDYAVGVKHLLTLILEQMTYSGGSQVERSRAWCAAMNCPFFRMDPKLEEKFNRAESDEGKLVDLMFISMLCAKRETGNLKEIARMLVKRRCEQQDSDV